MLVNMTHHHGFTFIELMTVTAVIGILAAIALPSYSQYTQRARTAEAFALAEPIQTDIARYYDRWGEFPADNAAAGLAAADRYIGSGVRSIRVQDGAIVINLDSERIRLPDKQQATIVLRPLVNTQHRTGALAWQCNESVVPEGFEIGAIPEFDSALFAPARVLPSACRK